MGYLPQLSKSILVVSLWNVERAEEFFRAMGIKFVTGSRYPGGFFGDREDEDSWLSKNIQGWAE